MLMQFNELTINEQQRCLQMLDMSARTDIELFCKTGRDSKGEPGRKLWINIAVLPGDTTENEMVEHAIWWCEKRGLFTYHPDSKSLIRFD